MISDLLPRALRHRRPLDELARLVGEADGLVIGAGAGMSVESGIPPYRGRGGTWLKQDLDAEGLTARDRASMIVLNARPETTVAHHAARWAQLAAARPHAGYQVLRDLADRLPAGAFVFTSNVDAMFVRAGFDETLVYECHGSQARSQCLADCGQEVFATPSADGRPARCPTCGGLARPNVLLFDDCEFDGSVRTGQWDRWGAWLRERADARLLVLECGAGTGIPAVRHRSESLASAGRRPLARINPYEPQMPADVTGVAVRLPARAALLALGHRLGLATC